MGHNVGGCPTVLVESMQPRIAARSMSARPAITVDIEGNSMERAGKVLPVAAIVA